MALDGIKIDFMDLACADSNTPLTATDGRDFASLDKAMVQYMKDMQTMIHKYKPDALIEFRQPYATPFMRKYANIYRARLR